MPMAGPTAIGIGGSHKHKVICHLRFTCKQHAVKRCMCSLKDDADWNVSLVFDLEPTISFKASLM